MTNPYVINLDSRPDRWQTLQNNWKGAFQLTRSPAVQASPGWVGCALSHIQIIEEAKARGDPYVLIWEDDCQHRNRHPLAIRELWNEILYKLSLNTEHWDVVLGATSAVWKGATYNPGLSTQHVKIYDIPHGFTTHWILYNASTYDRMIQWKDVRDPQIDVYLFKMFRVKVMTPFLAEQASGFSDIESRDVNYNEMFDRAEVTLNSNNILLSSLIKNAPNVQSPKFMTR